MSNLTPKQEAFCLAYLKTGNASEAYRLCYNTETEKPESVHRAAKAVLDNVKIASRIKELRQKSVTEAVMTRTEALERLSGFARVDLAQLVDFKQIEIGEDENGDKVIQTAWRVKDSALQDKDKMAAIAELTAGRDGIKIKTHSPLTAINQLAKMQGWETAQKFEHTSPDGSMTPKGIDASRLSTQALQELMAARNESSDSTK